MEVFEIEYWIIHRNCQMDHKQQDFVAENEEQALQDFRDQESRRDNLAGSWLVNKPFIRHKYETQTFKRGDMPSMSSSPIEDPEKVRRTLEIIRSLEPYFGR